MMGRILRSATKDIGASIARYGLVGTLGWQDVRQRYRRSALGPFWLTISMGVMIATLGLLFGQIFEMPMAEFLPFLAIGLILWTYISTLLSEGCTGFIAAEGIIKQLPIPLFVHMLRVMWRNTIILSHNVIIFPLVLVVMGRGLGWEALLALPAFILLTINLGWIALVLGVFCTRYRDVPQIVASVLQILFYLTPIIWMPHMLPERAGLYLLDLNPFYHLIEIVRSPLLGSLPSATNWIASLGLAVVGWMLALWIYGRYNRRIAYWL